MIGAKVFCFSSEGFFNYWRYHYCEATQRFKATHAATLEGRWRESADAADKTSLHPQGERCVVATCRWAPANKRIAALENF